MYIKNKSRLAAALSLAIILPAAAPSAHAQVSGSASLTSDYVWRGSSQTLEDPAVQAGFRYAHASGWYASVWGSSVEFAPALQASSEFDLAFGWAGKIAPDWALDLYLLRYQYPSTNADLNWNELNATLTWRDNTWLALGHSTNAMASGARGTYVLAGVRVPMHERVRVEGTLARYVLDQSYADSYSHANLSAIWAFQAPFEARLTLHATDSAARRLFPGMGGSRAEFALQASF
ncbi:hypothetical protein IM543_02805 [Massilia sp. UMI-21]|nr:hypothetical protein IM543_02805 [Massilia sp. UMI-21]